MPGVLQFGPLSNPALEPLYRHALHMTMQTYKIDPAQSSLINKVRQTAILNTLHQQCCYSIKPFLQSNEQYYDEERHAKDWPFWRIQNDALRKIVLGKYKASSLPLPFVNASQQ